MASIYLHIPFCKQACYYCDFHFSTSLKNKDALIQALKTEITLQHSFFKHLDNEDQLIESIYFGGGTPSLALGSKEINSLINLIEVTFNVSSSPEITLEANPDDLSEEYLDALRQTAVNRLSIGVQSFHDNDLKYLNRSHQSNQAIIALKNASDKGFSNISLDLIYGIPSSSLSVWKQNLDIVKSLPVVHLSCYNLTIEPNTVFGNWYKKKKIQPASEQDVAMQFNYLLDWSHNMNYIHYEISNLCKDKYFSKHNTAYWQNKAYLGIGPSAHSYNLTKRFWNASNNSTYIKSISKKTIPNQLETLSKTNCYNEYIMAGLRTMWGINLTEITSRFGVELGNNTENAAKSLIESGHLIRENDILLVSSNGKLITDKIITSFIVSEE